MKISVGFKFRGKSRVQVEKQAGVAAVYAALEGLKR
jgi:hypothetical protein